MIGRPLDVRIQVLLAPGEDLSNLCIQTDVFYGDTQVSANLVRTSPQRNTPDVESSVRVQSSLPVNEPFVTLYVKAGCGTQFTRRFVLLADLVNEPLTAAVPPAATPATAPAMEPSALPRVAAAPGPASSIAAAPASGASSPRSPAPARADAPAPRPPSVVRRVPPKPPAAPAAPRLQLDPIDLTTGIERDPTLKLSPLLLSEPSSSEEARAAAAQLWKSINATPEEILRDAQKLAALESEVAKLREEQSRTQAALGDLSAQLEQSQAQRFQNWLVYLLGACLLLALLAVLFVWRRRQEVVVQGSEASRAWWAPEDEEPTQRAPLNAADTATAGASDLTPLSPVTSKSDSVDLDLDFDLDQDSSFDGLNDRSGKLPVTQPMPATPMAESAVAARDRREFSTSAMGVSRSVATEELFDVQQQADFFVSLGEDEQAIQVLKDHLTESHEPSALTYLDLFHIYHRLGRRNDYEALRDEFNHVFNAGAPPFDSYSQRGQGLESYETAFSRIQALWPQPRVLDLIEQSIFRDSTDSNTEVFDLEAYRELLMLHAIAKDLIQRDSNPPRAAGDFQHTAMQPLKAAGNTAPAASRPVRAASDQQHTQPMALGDTPPASSRLGLDINLDDLSEMAQFEASLPEVGVPVEASAKPTQPADFDIRPGEDNLIDFEVIDFDPSQDPADDEKPNGGR